MLHNMNLKLQIQTSIPPILQVVITIRNRNAGCYNYCSLRPKILVVLTFDFYVCVQIDDDKSRYVYKINALVIIY